MEPFKSPWGITVLCFCLTIQLNNGASAQHAEMFGGSMSFEIEKSGKDFTAKIKVLTAWKIGTGPCGAECNYTDIERSTATVRRDLLNKYGPEYLGIWQGERGVYGITTSRSYVNMTPGVNSHIIEKVQLLNMGLHWEMDQADITATISQGTDYMDMKFIGKYWVTSTVSQNVVPQQEMWMQTKIRTGVRSDTQMSNRSPVLQIKPYQRFLINKTTTISVNYIDQDDDLVRCEFSSFGTSNGIKTPKGLSMNKFYFEVVDHLNEPEFIHPTPPNGQHYEIYSGAAFTVNIFATPTDNSSTTEIDQFLLTRRDGIHVDKSIVTKRSELGSRVQSITLNWTPKRNEAGKHLVCSFVIDTLGYDSPLRCFNILVKDMPLKPVISLKGKPYFLHFPENEDIVCQVDSVCKFPLYASTDNPGGIVNITIIRKELYNLKREGQIKLKSNPTNISQGAWMTEISFQDPRHGEKQFCAKAIDKFASIEQCTVINVKPRDPCLSSPCQNGECIARKDGTAQCFCKHGASGERCQNRPDPCYDKQFCKNGGQCIPGGYCVCPSGVTGMNCENGIYLVVTCRPILATLGNVKCIMAVIHAFVQKGLSEKIARQSKFVSPTLAAGSVITCDPLSGITELGATNDCQFPVHVFWNGDNQSKKPVVEGTSISKDMKIARLSEIMLKLLNTTNTAGFDKTLTAIVKLVNPDNQQFQIGMHVVCLFVKQEKVQTDYRCFRINVDLDVLKLPKRLTKNDGRLFESPTLPEGSVIVCVKDKLCHINLYTEYKSSPTCLPPVFQSDAQCTVFGPKEIEFFKSGTVCHSDIAYSTGGLAVGTKKDICFQATQDGETRCFLLHIIADSKDPCSSNPCQNDGLCVALSDGTHSCMCKLGFYGNSCEIGSCPVTTTNQQYCQNDGHCHTDSIKKTCFCRLGSIGSQCVHKTTESLTNPATSGTKFIGSSLPTTIKCHLGDPCEIPSVLTGDPNVKPSMKKGFVDSSVEVQGMHVTQDKNSSHVYHTVTSILPKKTGNHKVCVQNVNAAGQTADELCYSIEVTAELPKPVSNRKPQFISPTLPDGSGIECSVGEACHMNLWIKSQVYNPNCPLVESDMKAPDGIFVFQSDTDPSPCSTDVSIHTDIERTITVCFTLKTPRAKNGKSYGGEGEKRCYSITITNETLHARGPCSRLICMNQGFCNGKGNIGFCQCPSGYSGTTCQVAHGNSLTAPHSQPGSETGDHVLPQKVVCVLHEECSIPFTVTSSANPPSVRPGNTEAGLSSKGTTIIPDPKNTGTFLSQLNVVGNTPGVHKTCVQTGDNRETTSDEFCFEVVVKSPEKFLSFVDSYNHEVKTSQPYFVTPTIPHDSVTQCVPGKSCHVLLFMSGGVYPECPSVEQTQGPTDDLHLFTSADNSKLIGNCTADVTLTPPSGSTGKYRFCFKTFIPNIPGEIRCFYVKYMDYSAPSPSCKGTSCQDGSVCDIINRQPTCICALLQSGQHCQQAGSSGTPHTSSPPLITDLPLPKVIRCEVGTFCIIPTLVNGDINNPPKVTIPTSNPNMISAPPSIHQDSKYPKGTYKVDGSVNVTKEGIYELCMIIEHGGQTCFKIEAFKHKNSTQSASNTSYFEGASLPPDSTVVCKPTTTCHLILYQRPESGRCVPAVGETLPGGTYIVSPSSPDDSGFCETDIVYKPLAGAKSQKVCVRAKGDNNSDGELRCFKIDPSLNDTNPCHTAICHTGDCVLTVDEDVECKCRLGTTGKTCEQDTKNLISGSAVSEKPGFVDTVKPETIICYTGQSCGIPVAVNRNGGQSTKVRVTDVPPNAVTTTDLTLTPIPGTNISQSIVQIQSTNPANLTKCVAVIESGQEKDKLCYNIEFITGPAPFQNGSKFTENSLGPNSEVHCETSIVCHLIVETSQQGTQCPKIKNTNPSVKGDEISDVYVFDPKQSTVNSKIRCTTDVAIKPSVSEAGRKEVCVTIEKSSGSQSDTRCYKVIVERGDACKPVECLNGGICKSVDNNEGIAVCVCPLGYSGNICQNKKDNSVTPFTGEEIPDAVKNKGIPKFTATSLPETIHCVVGQPCHLPMRVTDPTGNTPVIGFGQVDPGIITSPVTVTPSGNKTYTTDVVVTPTNLGKRRVCVQTKNTENEKVAETTFIKEVHIFQDSSAVGQTCTVDVGFTPTHDAGGTQHMCFKPGNKGEKRCIMVKIQDTSSYSTSSVVPVTGSATQEPNFVDTVVPREVKCYNGRECLIPFAVKGNSHSVEVGDHDNGMNTTIKPSTKLTSTDSVYEHIISVTPQTSEGKKEICVKTKTGKDDQICFTVDVVDPPANQGTTPDFTGTTLGPDSTVECQTGTLCHVQIQTNQTNGKCPAILENTDKTSISDVHIFPPQTNQCTTDVVLKPRVTETGQKQLCVHFNAGTVSKQENKERCFKVTVSNTIDPCVPVYCMNHGECQINNGQGECICPSGFTGGKCENVKSEKVTAVNLGVINPAQELPHFTNTAVPKIIKCVQDMPCHIPLTVTDLSGEKPSVKYGKVDPGIDTEKPELTPINGTKDFTTDITITPQEPGTKSLCVQTATSMGMNVDEICYQIQTSAIRPSPGGHPAFTAPTVTDSSTLLCEIGEICHIPLTYEGLKGTCEEVNEMPTHTAGVHIFKPPVQPTAVDKTCTTEIAYKPSTTGPTKLCFKPGSYGEKRCINIQGEPKGQKLSTPCQSQHCKNNGECIADNQGIAKCLCTLGKSGGECNQNSSNFITDRVNSTKPAFIDTVLPQTIVCYKLEKCTVPFVVTSTAGIPTVKNGQTDPNIVATGPSTPTQIKGTDSFKTEITINSTDNGVILACVQTQDSSGKTVDEICVKVNVKDHPNTATTTLPGFTEKTFKPESVLGCKVDQDCHLSMETTKNSNGKCSTLSKDILKTTIQDVHPMETILSTVNSTCQTDVVIHPNRTEIGIHEVCIQINVSPSEEPRCYKLNVTESQITPCQAKNCLRDGFCSVTSGNQTVCTCRIGSTGPRCQTDSTSSIVPATGTTTQEPYFVDTVVPREVKCYKGKECLIPFAVKGNNQSVEVGDHDNGMNPMIKPSTKLTSTDGVYEHILSVTPQTSEGRKTMCVKKTTTGYDQICFTVDVVDPPTIQGTTTPDFIGTTLGPDSTVECQTGTLCHVQIQTNQTNGKCPAILRNTNKTSLSDVHIFPAQTNDCTTDVVLKPRVTETGQKQLCVHFNAGPSVKFGKVDPGIDTDKPVLTPVNGTQDFTTDIKITPQKPGTKHLCVQTQTSLGMNVDEICYQIQTSATKPSFLGNPAFTAPTVTDSSTLLCEIGEICHIPLTYEGLNGTCEEINELPTHTVGVHIFKPPVQPIAVGKSCTTEIAYKPSTTGPTKLCFKPGSLGEKRCINIEGKPSGNKLSTPCQSLHCKDNGECIADNKGIVKCVCTLGKSGVDCSQGSSNFITDSVNKTKPAFTDTVLPQTIVCYKLEKCTVPFVVTSTAGNTPTVKTGHTNPGIVATRPSTPTQITGTDSYKTEITINSTDNGVKLACVQTQGPSPTLSKDTLRTTIQDVHPLETILSTVDSTCQTDVVIHPNSTEMGIHEVCIQINVSPSEEPRCYKLNVTQSLVTTTTFTSTVATTTNVETTFTTTVGSLKTTKVADTTSVETTITTTVGSLKTTQVAAKTNNTKTSKAATTNTLAASNSITTIQRIATTNNPKATGTTDNAKTTKAETTIKTIPKVTASTNTTMAGKFTGNKTKNGVATIGTNAKLNKTANAKHSINIHNLVKPDDKTTKIGLPTTNGNPIKAVITANGKVFC
ncbi:Hypothetical predicted protein [Mytilus galloprovincialis]|uniref:EGF-like domain-containing protein n=1 Tax=Mytilus galloprovincialis TaxID=29158 RepID=A0A8B6EQM3_MYTGA|nr:Hypothetical predicted protein [Mytilus galloprovincialis]